MENNLLRIRDYEKGCSNMILVLDIGTRSIVGILGTIQGQEILIKHLSTELHTKRAMYDGQIHDIEGVAELVKKVKEDIEEKAGFKIKEVAIAAAGRTLKTLEIKVDRDLDELQEIDRDLLNSIEIEGIQRAQAELEEKSYGSGTYFPVGHTVVNYYLNNGFITNPLGHRGKTLKADILATFLPKIVIDSLYTVMAKVGLEVSYLTLEPIAAKEVAIPENMRLLNIALVDIGAGTCDIAITKEGSVTAYGMTSTAGDEITEELARAYLLDFDTAERVKCNLLRENEQKFVDIVGVSHRIDTETILNEIQPSIELVAKSIADNILKHNKKSPSAVFLIGGGSQIPRLNTLIANYLQLARERVVVRGMEAMENVRDKSSLILGPEGITPIGILSKALKNKFSDFIEVKIGDKEITMLKTRELKVRDALITINFDPRKLIPSKAKNLTIYINGQEKTLYSKYGEAARILINGDRANLDSLIGHGDVITISPATEGQVSQTTLGDLLDLDKEILVNDKKIKVYNDIRVNGRDQPSTYIVEERDKISYYCINTVQKLCDFLELSYETNNIYINGGRASLHDSIKGGDNVQLEKTNNVIVGQKEPEKANNKISFYYNGQPMTITSSKKQLIFVDIFDYVDFDRTKVQGKLVLKHNGIQANYTAPLIEGDEIWVYWE